MENIASGPVVTIIGIGTVFVALAILVAVLNLIRWLLERSQNKSESSSAIPVRASAVGSADQASAGAQSAGAKEGDNVADQIDNLQTITAVALAAYGMHRHRRVAVRGPSPQVSAWALAARTHQTRRSDHLR